MPGLDSYLVTLGVKGQDVVLATMDKLRKKGGDLQKKKIMIPAVPDVGAKKKKTPSNVAKAAGVKTKDGGVTPEVQKQKKKKTPADVAKAEGVKTKDGGGEPEVQKQNKKKEKDTEVFREGAKKFGGAVQKFSQSAASIIDPVSTIQSVTSSIGTLFSGISILGVSLGRLPEGVAALTNSALTMAKNSMDMAKQSTAAYRQLAERNANREFYGEKVAMPVHFSRNDMAMLVDVVAGSMGKIQGPLAEQINKLSGTKSTTALARVAAGDWESTGTDKGWMIQQMMNGVQGLPPSIKQRVQASMLSQNADLIQEYAPGQKTVQAQAAQYVNLEEDQTKTIYEKANIDDVVKASKNFNTLQANMFDAGMKMTGAINAAAEAAEKLPQTLEDMKKSVVDLTNSIKSHLPKSMAQKMPVFK